MTWIKEKLGKRAQVISGYAFKSSDFLDYSKGNIPIIKIKNIKNGYVDINNDTQYVSKNKLNLDKKYIVENGDILISLTGSQITQPNSVVGRIAKCYFPNFQICLLNQRAGKFLINEDKMNRNFLFYLLTYDKYKQALALMGHGAASQANISPLQIENLEIFFPDDTKEQDKIAKFLSNYDDLIENNNRRIKILEEMAQKIYKEWFVDFKFPGHEITTIKESVLSSIITPIKGKNITKSKAKIGNVPVVGGGIEPAYYHNVANTQAPVITISASGANAGFVNLYYKDIWASDCSYIDATMTNYIYYTYLLLKNNQIEITNMQLGAAQPHVYPRDLVNLKIKEFPIEVVANFEKMISPIFENIKVLSNKNENLKQTRDILLPRLISGEINVENMEVL